MLKATAWSLVAAMMLHSWTAVAAQGRQRGRQRAEPPPQAFSIDEPVDIEALPVSVVRIKRRLAELPPIDSAADLRLSYYVSVYGRMPSLELFTGVDFGGAGAFQYGAPTHQEFLNLVTPQAFRTPVMDLGSLLFGLGTAAAKKAAEKRKDAERRRIAAEAQRIRPPGSQ
jgi:hypothetical protein